MNVLEHELEEIIYQYSFSEENRAILRERGLPVYSKLERQVGIGGYGIIDLLGHSLAIDDTEIHVKYTVYELKKEVINEDALKQLYRYMAGVREAGELIAGRIGGEHDKDISIDVDGVLVGKRISNGDFTYLLNHLPICTSIFEYSISIEEGVKFTEVEGKWVLTDSGIEEGDDPLSLQESIEIATYSDHLKLLNEG